MERDRRNDKQFQMRKKSTNSQEATYMRKTKQKVKRLSVGEDCGSVAKKKA